MFTRSRMIVLLLSLLAFGAGLSVAKVIDRRPHPPERGPSWLSSELKLTPEQRQSMLAIWGNLNRSGFDEGDRRRELGRQRMEAIRQLIPADQQEKLAQIDEQYTAQMAELSSQRRQRFEEAMEKTRAVLTPDQLQKYDEILKRRMEERRRGRGDRPREHPDAGPRPERPRPPRPGFDAPPQPPSPDGQDRPGPPAPPAPATQPQA